MPLTAPPARPRPWLAEPPPLVRGYRRAVPLPVRRAVVAMTGAGLRRAAMRGLGSASAVSGALRLRRARQRLRRSGLLGSPGRILITDRRAARVATVAPAPTPLFARAENLRLVCEALDRAELDHFVVRCPSNLASAVGVRADQRAQVSAALTALCAREAGYVSQPARPKHPATPPRLGASTAAWRRLKDAPVVRFTRYHAGAAGRSGERLVLGPAHGCDIEFWEPSEQDGRPLLLAPRFNRTTASVPLVGEPVRASGHLFTRLAPADGWRSGPLVRTRPEFLTRLPDEVRFPIDVVYTWVDGSDPLWQRRRAAAAGLGYHAQAANAARYANRDELRYSLRSLYLYAPWVRHIYIVTDRQVPDWLALSHPGITVVDHQDIFDDPGALPTFNSHAIETRLHHIHGLAEHFLYFNDDVFLGSPVTPQDFFLANGVSKFFPSRALIPLAPPDPDDVPVSAAGKNNRVLLESRFGATVTQKMKHTPHAVRRSVLAEIEREFPEEVRATMASRVRSASDVSVPSSLHHYYAFLTGRAVPSSLRYDYFDLSQPAIRSRLARLLRSRHRQAFCLNDTVSSEHELADQLAVLHPFLDAYFPVPSPLERAPSRQETRQPCPSPSLSR
ncbi:stealth family protein [Streptomyces coffeae]|uniref:Stealth family protein n=1 Tax=Streptomyces coffeae TaxID=621382 RepID=A0ABS1NI12_9ACTN|nr:stealth family protein [Streptomyces coffeae]MBL1099535.1 stealth family protein [Streptomyces coffeae]